MARLVWTVRALYERPGNTNAEAWFLRRKLLRRKSVTVLDACFVLGLSCWYGFGTTSLRAEITMPLVLEKDPIPLRRDDSGTIRVGATRVTLSSIVIAYQQGNSPEVIAEQYPSVELADIFAVIAYYLRHRAEVDEYLADEERLAEALRREWQNRFPTVGLKERLLARRAANSDK
jgi:uncharacterized protein (DUF433 family)